MVDQPSHRLDSEKASMDRPLRDSALADQVYEKVLTMIVEGAFPENSRLTPEKILSEQLGVSRPVLRQALRRLRNDGIIYSQQGSGSYIQRQPSRAILSFAPVGSIGDIQRTFEFRTTIEADAAALAAERWKDEDLARIKAALDALDQCIQDGSVGAEADEEFHVAVCAATDNHYFVSARSSLKMQILTGMKLARSLSLTKPAQRLQLVQDEHRDIYQSIQDRKADAAREAMHIHVENARARVFEGTSGSEE